MPPHNPVERLNEHHAAEVLAVARAFGFPDATGAHAVEVDDDGIVIAVDTPSGPVEVRVRFAEAMPDADSSQPLRMRFRELARRAHGDWYQS
jgi:hypothetical protein